MAVPKPCHALPHTVSQSPSSPEAGTEEVGDNSSKATIKRALRPAKSIVPLSFAALSLSPGSYIIACNI